MNEQEIKLMKGNEAIAHAAIRCGCDGYFGYPITPQSEIIETLAQLKPWETTGMVVLQAESEVASINMLYGGGDILLEGDRKEIEALGHCGVYNIQNKLLLVCHGYSIVKAGMPILLIKELFADRKGLSVKR